MHSQNLIPTLGKNSPKIMFFLKCLFVSNLKIKLWREKKFSSWHLICVFVFFPSRPATKLKTWPFFWDWESKFSTYNLKIFIKNELDCWWWWWWCLEEGENKKCQEKEESKKCLETGESEMCLETKENKKCPEIVEN